MSSLSHENLVVCVVLVYLLAFVYTSCVDGLVLTHSKVESLLISGIGGVLGITLSMDTIAFELNVSMAKFGILCMEAMFLESPPLGLKNPMLWMRWFLDQDLE